MSTLPLLSVDSIDTYYGQSHILSDVSLKVNKGEILALIGRNGAGKTTTLRSIMGLTPPESGIVRFRDEEVHTLSPHETRCQGISWVPEDRRVFPDLTVEENLKIAAAPSEEQDDFSDVYQQFDRLEERRNQSAGTLSGGEQQMLAIARAMVGPETDLLMLDEPSEGLAPQIVDDVKEIIHELNRAGTTILLVEQNAEMALELADRAYILETGQIEFEERTEYLRDNREVVQQYLGVN